MWTIILFEGSIYLPEPKNKKLQVSPNLIYRFEFSRELFFFFEIS